MMLNRAATIVIGLTALTALAAGCASAHNRPTNRGATSATAARPGPPDLMPTARSSRRPSPSGDRGEGQTRVAPAAKRRGRPRHLAAAGRPTRCRLVPQVAMTLTDGSVMIQDYGNGSGGGCARTRRTIARTMHGTGRRLERAVGIRSRRTGSRGRRRRGAAAGGPVVRGRAARGERGERRQSDDDGAAG